MPIRLAEPAPEAYSYPLLIKHLLRRYNLDLPVSL
jgi:hypothetical protein